MKIDLSLEALCLLSEAMEAAGDGQCDPFTSDERALVARELAPHAEVIRGFGERHRGWLSTFPRP